MDGVCVQPTKGPLHNKAVGGGGGQRRAQEGRTKEEEDFCPTRFGLTQLPKEFQNYFFLIYFSSFGIRRLAPFKGGGGLNIHPPYALHLRFVNAGLLNVYIHLKLE